MGWTLARGVMNQAGKSCESVKEPRTAAPWLLKRS
jgi:hypothetical protein